MSEELVRIALVEPHQAPMQVGQVFGRKLLQLWVHRIAADDFEVVAVGVGVAHHAQAQVHQLAVILRRHARDHVAAQALHSGPLLRGHVHGGQRLFEIVRHSAQRVMRVGQAIEGKIQVDYQLGAALEQVVHDRFDLCGELSGVNHSFPSTTIKIPDGYS